MRLLKKITAVAVVEKHAAVSRLWLFDLSPVSIQIIKSRSHTDMCSFGLKWLKSDLLYMGHIILVSKSIYSSRGIQWYIYNNPKITKLQTLNS